MNQRIHLLTLSQSTPLIILLTVLCCQQWYLSIGFAIFPTLNTHRHLHQQALLLHSSAQFQWQRRQTLCSSNPKSRPCSANKSIHSKVLVLRGSQTSNNEQQPPPLWPSPSNNASPSPPSSPLKVGIVGAGSIAFGTASLAASLGHDPMIWSPSGEGTKELVESASLAAAVGGEESSFDFANNKSYNSNSASLSKASTSTSTTDTDTIDNGIRTSPITAEIKSTGAIAQTFKARIASSLQELVQENDNILILALPVNGHKQVMERLAPCIIERIVTSKEEEEKVTKQVEVQRGSVDEADNKNQEKIKKQRSSSMMHIIISSHASLSAVYFMQLLREERKRYARQRGIAIDQNYDDDDNDLGIRITAWGTTAITARKTSGASVNVLTVRKAVDYCTVPSIVIQENAEHRDDDTTVNDGYNLCTALFGERFHPRKGGLLAISLSNLNPQNHLGIVLGNMSRMDPPPPPPPPVGMGTSTTKTQPGTTVEPWYQGKYITPNVGRLMEALDNERLAIASQLDIQVRTIYEHFSWSFHVPMETPVEQQHTSENNSQPSSSTILETTATRPVTVSEMNQQMHYYLDNDVLGPTVPDSRYVLEDVPYGLVLTVILGQLVDKPAILHESGIRILSAMYGRDFMVENELLRGLGLVGEREEEVNIPSLEMWREMAYTGYFREEYL